MRAVVGLGIPGLPSIPSNPPSPAQSIPSVQASQRHRSHSRSPLRGRKRARNVDQVRDIAKLKGQLAQILEHLSRQQVPPAPAPAPLAPAPEYTPALPVVATEVEQQEVVMSEEEKDALSLVVSWDEESFLRTETQDTYLTQSSVDLDVMLTVALNTQPIPSGAVNSLDKWWTAS
ncbi:UNVERIFIED_CONTAM: hypothetical protein FKN15_037362 [Acipenser sinensis]